MIELGLSRIHALLSSTPLPWRAIHVAGTNGKGTVCATISSLLDVYNSSPLRAASSHPPLRHARFTSPHLMRRGDSIVIDSQAVSEAQLLATEKQLHAHAANLGIKPSEFETLTAAAFELFTSSGIELAVVEVGLGGALDATNVLGLPADEGVARPVPLVAGITSLGLDHVDFLGGSLVEIARAKAGIVKKGIGAVVAARPAENAVMEVIAAAAKGNDVRDLVFVTEGTRLGDVWMQNSEGQGGPEDGGRPVQKRWPNGAVAVQATWKALKQMGRLEGTSTALRRELLIAFGKAVDSVVWHGRLERVDLTPLVGIDSTAVVDGAHNADSAKILRQYLDETSDGEKGTDWVIAISGAHKVKELLPILLRPHDAVHAVEFGPVDGMPWIKPVRPQDIIDEAAKLTQGEPLRARGHRVYIDQITDASTHQASGRQLLQTLTSVCAQAHENKRRVVVTGSLYLVGEVHQLLQARAPKK